MQSFIQQYFTGKHARSILLLFLISILFVHLIPSLSIPYLILLLFIYSRTSNNALFFALFVILVDSPGGLFAKQQLSVLPFLRDVNFFELFVIISFFKAFRHNKNGFKIYGKELLYTILVYAVFLFIYSIFIGMDLLKIGNTLRLMLFWSLFYSIPKLLFNNNNTIVSFFKYLFPLLSVYFIFLIFYYVTGYDVKSLFSFSNINVKDTDDLLRVISGNYLLYFTLLGSVYYFGSNRFNDKFLMFNIIIIMLSMLSTATRGWIIGFSLIVIIYFFLSGYFKKNVFNNIPLIFSVILIFILLIPPLQKQISFSYDRLLTIESVFKGDETAQGTLSRLSERGPKVMQKYYESPIIGFGFSDEYHEFDDVHVGNQTLLLQGGIILFLLILTLVFIYGLYAIKKVSSSIQKNAYVALFSVLLSIIVIHSTSEYMFNLKVRYQASVFLTFYFSLFSYTISQKKLIGTR